MTLIRDAARPVDREIVTDASTSRAWWFLGTLAVLRNPHGAPRTPAVIELTVPPGGSPPRHVHQTLDDAFLVLAGELVLHCGDEKRLLSPGAYVVVPSGVEHTFRVTGRRPARLLLVHADDSFLRLVETVGTPAGELRLPPPGTTDVDVEMLRRASAENDATVVGPSLEADEVRQVSGGHDDVDRLGPINHVALQVTDLARSERWYTDAFDLVRVDGHIAEDGTGHVTLRSPSGGWILALASAPVARVEHVALTCDDRDALVRWRESLPARGAAPGTITDAPYGSGFVLRDPDGIEVELFAPASTRG
jgi:quercetin dioxygenase-like cupin family protein/catechol 2,3-dioxygenase-like lactoylglutathione lyase family enzyme